MLAKCVYKLYIYVNYIYIPVAKQAATQDRTDSKDSGTHDTMKGSKTPRKGR